eukprot:6188457-Pleurochrysis_carterae.AAC.4
MRTHPLARDSARAHALALMRASANTQQVHALFGDMPADAHVWSRLSVQDTLPRRQASRGSQITCTCLLQTVFTYRLMWHIAPN